MPLSQLLMLITDYKLFVDSLQINPMVLTEFLEANGNGDLAQ